MKKKNKLPENTMSVLIHIFEEDENADLMNVGVAYNFSEDMPEEEQTFYIDVLNGLAAHMNTGLESLSFTGMLLRQISELEESNEIEFEPAEELLEAVENGKVIQLKKKLH